MGSLFCYTVNVMWEKLPVQKKVSTSFFSDWLDQYVLVDFYGKKSIRIFKDAEKISSIFSKLRVIPQTPPYHSEGPFASDGILRAISGLYAVLDGARLLSIESFIRERHFNEEIRAIEDTMREQIASLTVYLLMHDLGKVSTLVLDAPAGSRGEIEGFSQHGYRSSSAASVEELLLFGKLYKSFSISKQHYEKRSLVAGFYDKYEIHAHYPDHAKLSIDSNEEVFESISDHFRLPERDRELIKFSVRNHMYVISAFGSGPNFNAYKLLVSRAHKAGFDADDALDFIMAATFLDVCVGSLTYRLGEFISSVEIILNILRSEEHVSPHRREERRKKRTISDEKFLRYVLNESELDGDSLFKLLQTPFGPERGKIVAEIRSLVMDVSIETKFTNHSHELERRVKKARELFDVVR